MKIEKITSFVKCCTFENKLTIMVNIIRVDGEYFEVDTVSSEPGKPISIEKLSIKEIPADSAIAQAVLLFSKGEQTE
jgi:hypothetical protein